MNPSCGLDNWCKEYSESLHGGDPYVQETEWVDSEYGVTGWHKTCGKSDGQHSNHTGVDHYDESGHAWWIEYISPSGDKWYWYETEWVPATTKTQYRYRDKKTVYLYERYICRENWSDWSDLPVSADGDRRDVRTKTQYKYEYYSS